MPESSDAPTELDLGHVESSGALRLTSMPNCFNNGLAKRFEKNPLNLPESICLGFHDAQFGSDRHAFV